MRLVDLKKLYINLGKCKKWYWSRKPGKFVNKRTGNVVDMQGCKWEGSAREWYECMGETIIDAANTEKMGNHFNVIVSPDVATMCECSVLYIPLFLYDKKGNMLVDKSNAPLSAETLMGSYFNRFDVYRDQDFPRNRILIFSDLLDKFAELEVVDMDII